MTGLAGIVAYLGALVAAGAIKRHSGDIFGTPPPPLPCPLRCSRSDSEGMRLDW